MKDLSRPHPSVAPVIVACLVLAILVLGEGRTLPLLVASMIILAGVSIAQRA